MIVEEKSTSIKNRIRKAYKMWSYTCTDAASEPLLGSVRQNAAVHSPVAKRGKYLAFCSSFPAIKRP